MSCCFTHPCEVALVVTHTRARAPASPGAGPRARALSAHTSSLGPSTAVSGKYFKANRTAGQHGAEGFAGEDRDPASTAVRGRARPAAQSEREASPERAPVSASSGERRRGEHDGEMHLLPEQNHDTP